MKRILTDERAFDVSAKLSLYLGGYDNNEVDKLEAKKGEMETQLKLNEAVLQKQFCKVQTTMLKMDTKHDKADEVVNVMGKVDNEAGKQLSIQSGKAVHQEMKELAPGKEREHTLMARRGKCDSVCNHQETGVSQNERYGVHCMGVIRLVRLSISCFSSHIYFHP